jgi:hypothetical protein
MTLIHIFMVGHSGVGHEDGILEIYHVSSKTIAINSDFLWIAY